TVFLNGVRRAVNKTREISPKITWAIGKINRDLDKNKKVLVYSSWLDRGIHIIRDYLKKNDIPFSMVSGSITKQHKDESIALYNSGKHKVMLITASGAEGIDLKGTRTVI